MRLIDWKRLWTGSVLLMLAVYTAGSFWVVRGMDEAVRRPVEPLSGAEDPVEVAFTGSAPWARPGLEKIAARVETYQLAGTYQTFTYEDETSDPRESALAMVDDLESGRQQMVREGDTLGPFTVAAIDRDSIRLRYDERSWTLQLSGRLASGSTAESGSGNEEEEGGRRFDNLPALETTRFGKRVADNQWVLEREKVKAYAHRIAGNPLRAANLYRSFSQVAEEEGQDEAGFRIQMKGEKDFFGEMGLTDEDVIRRVNSMKMKNQNRAEYLVSEFMQDRMGMVVLDVERDGEVEKLIYVIQD